jgi:hypothetical protein
LFKAARESGKSDEEAVAAAARALPALATLKGRARQVAIWLLLALAEKGVEHVVDEIIKPEELSQQRIELTVKEAVREELRAFMIERDAAQAKPQPTEPTSLQLKPTPPLGPGLYLQPGTIDRMMQGYRRGGM